MAEPTKPPNLSQTCSWDKLPKEMVDRICHFAHAHKSNSDIVTRSQRTKLQTLFGMVNDTSAIERRFVHKVTKNFFDSAAKAFVGAQVWRIEVSSGLKHILEMGVVRRYCTVMQDSFWNSDITAALNLPGLKVLTLRMVPHGFHELTELGKAAWEHELDEEDYEKVPELCLLAKLRGLADFRLQHCHCIFADTEAQRRMWRRNVDKLGHYIRKIVTKPKPYSQQPMDGRPTPLYPGSLVVFNRSALLPDPGNADFVGEWRYKNGQYEKFVSRPTTPDEFAQLLGKRGAELWDYIVWLERCKNAACANVIQVGPSFEPDLSDS